MTFENWQSYVPLFVIITCSIGLVVLSGYIDNNRDKPSQVKRYTNISRWTAVVIVLTAAYSICKLQKSVDSTQGFGFG